MPIETAIEQAAIEDSVLSDPSRNLGTISEVFERTEAANTPDANGLYPDDYPPGHQPEAEQVEEEEQLDAFEMANVASREELEEMGLLEEQGQGQSEQAPAQGLSIEQAIEQYQLADPEEGNALAEEFMTVFGAQDLIDSMMDVEQFHSTLNQTALSIGSLYDSVQGDPSRLQLPDLEASGREWGNDFLWSFGVDPRLMSFDAGLLGWTVLSAAWNVIATYDGNGKTWNPQRDNAPDSAVAFWGQFLRAFGNEDPVDRAQAVRVADVFARGLLGPIEKIGKGGGPQSRPVSRTPSQPSKTRRAIPQMQSNTDLFDRETMERIAMERPL